MQKRILFLGLAAVFVVGGSTPLIAQAYQGDITRTNPNCSSERQAVMQQAFDANDYDAWKSQMAGKGRVTEKITRENFHLFAQMHSLKKAGEFDKARAIQAQLGLGQRENNQNGTGSGQMHREYSTQK